MKLSGFLGIMVMELTTFLANIFFVSKGSPRKEELITRFERMFKSCLLRLGAQSVKCLA